MVTVFANTPELLDRCLAGVADAADAIAVFDNGSRPRVELPAGVSVLRSEAGTGFATACNRAAETLDCTYLLFLNSDVVASPGAVARLTTTLEGTGAVAVGGRLVDPGTTSTQAAYRPRTFPTAATLAVQLLGLARIWPGNPITRRHLGEHLPEGTASEVDQPAAACLLVRADAFWAVGGFDERYHFWYEDVDLARRLSARGPIVWEPRAVFEHVGGASFRRWRAEQVIDARHDGLARYVHTHLGGAQRFLVGAAMILSVLARATTADGAARSAFMRAAGRGLRLMVTSLGRRMPQWSATSPPPVR